MSTPERLARERVMEAGGPALCERLEHLDAMRERRAPSEGPAIEAPRSGEPTDYDVAIVGGGLSLLLAPLLASRGLRVAVFDRARVGEAHREWNGGAAEVAALERSGLVSAEDWPNLIVAQYDYGVCRWHGGRSYPVAGVLDRAIDAGGLLRIARSQAEARGVSVYDHHALVGLTEGKDAVALAFQANDAAGLQKVTALIAVDARGASSPNATADLLCPTVGGVVGGLREGEDERAIHPRVGEILATTEDVVESRQHIWEAFPGRAGETTVYLFYYDLAERVGPGSLMSLYARFFEQLGHYKDGDPTLVRPTFGYIPGWSRLVPPPRAEGRRVVLVGDAAARHSPLTFCGFGHTVRSLERTVDVIVARVEGRWGEEDSDASIHAGTGALARMMAVPSKDPARAHDLNALLDTAFGVLHEMGEEAYGQLLRDEMSTADFVRFLHKTSLRRPRVYRDVFESFSLPTVGRWGSGLLRALLAA